MPFEKYIELILFVALVSLIDYVIRLRIFLVKELDLNAHKNRSGNFTIIVPIFGKIKYLKNEKYLKRYRSRVILLTSDQENKSFLRALDRRHKKYGFRIVKVPVPATQKGINNPWMLVKELFSNHRYLIRTKYCLLIDADTYPESNVRKLIGVVQKYNYDIASVGVLPSSGATLPEKLQEIEYASSMRANNVYANSVSGASMVGKTTKLVKIFKHHTGFPNGGDLERGMIAKGMGMNIGYIPFVFYTEVPATFKAWFRQRQFWFAGGFRRNVINMHFVRHEPPFYFFYNTILIYLFLPFRWIFLAFHFTIFPLVIGIYWLYAFIYYRKWQPYYLFYPFYAITQNMILAPIGAYTYLKRALILRNPGYISLQGTKPYTNAGLIQKATMNITYMVFVPMIVLLSYVLLIESKF